MKYYILNLIQFVYDEDSTLQVDHAVFMILLLYFFLYLISYISFIFCFLPFCLNYFLYLISYVSFIFCFTFLFRHFLFWYYDYDLWYMFSIWYYCIQEITLLLHSCYRNLMYQAKNLKKMVILHLELQMFLAEELVVWLHFIQTKNLVLSLSVKECR